MLERAKYLLKPSARSAVPPFMVMDVVAAATRLEAQGRRIIHMEVGQPAAGAPATAIAAARAALASARLGYTETLGVASLRRRIAHAYAEWHGLEIDPARIVVTTGSSAGFMLAFLAAFEAGDRVATALPGYPPYRHILSALGCEPVGIETTAQTRWAITPRSFACAASRAPAQRRDRGLSGQSDRHDDDGVRARRADPLRRGCRHRRHLGRDLSRPRLRLCRRDAPRAFRRDAIIINSFSKYFCMTGWRIGWMVVPPSLIRTVERLQQNLAISVPDAFANRRRSGVRGTRGA